MINLRYHIVSITAVFLALGIGITMGSSFLERATVESLNSQLDSLEGRITERDERIAALESGIEDDAASRAALDSQAISLLAGRASGIDVVVLTTEGTDEADVDGLVRTLVVAGARVHGIWTLTDRFLLRDDGAIRDLEAAVGGASDIEPAALRTRALTTLGGELRLAQIRGRDDDPTDPGTDPATDPGDGDGDAESPAPADPAPAEPAPAEPPPVEAAPEPVAGDPAGPVEPPETTEPPPEVPSGPTFAQLLSTAGFLDFEAVVGGPETPIYPDGTQLVIVSGSAQLTDALVVEPLVARLTRAVSGPVPVVVASATQDGSVASAVQAIRSDPDLRPVVSTVDALDHFEGWAATVLAVADENRTIAGHYGLGEGATLLIPAQQES